jgi:hypothetical protein
MKTILGILVIGSILSIAFKDNKEDVTTEVMLLVYGGITLLFI